MGPKDQREATPDLFRQPLIELLNPRHELVKLAAVMDWSRIEASFGSHFTSHTGRPALPPRLVAGLLYLQHAYDCSDEVAVNTWVENPYWQHFTGETYFQTEAPIDPSSLTRWRKRVGEEWVELMLLATIEAGRKLGLLKAASVDRVIVDTTVMPKAIAHPTDSRLLETTRRHLVGLAQAEGLVLRQNYNREAPRLASQIGRYAHAKQYRRMKKSLRTLRSRVGRVMRDVGRQLERIEPARQDAAREGFVVGMRSMPGNPYDGHTLAEAVEQVSILTDRRPKTVVVDRGYRGVELDGVQILRSGQKRGITRRLHRMIKRRSAIEPTIGHMKMDGRLGRNWLKGALGDALHAVLCGAGHNIRLLLKKLRLFCAGALSWVLQAMGLTLRPLAVA